jgi:putative CocE/NonD family hydrolase
MARAAQRLLIGPWTHGWLDGAYPEHHFGLRASFHAVDGAALQLRWFDHWLKGSPNGANHEPPVRLFVMGSNVWRDEDDWPLPDTSYQPYFLHSGGHANTDRGDGLLSPAPPADEPSDVYRYDPRDPVPTVGGATFLPGLGFSANSGPRDQRAVEARPDVLCYTTPPLTEPLEVTGPIELVLYVSSSAPDTDFTGKLVDVAPDGRAMILTDGILRARYRDSFAEPALLRPGQVYALRIDIGATANVFQVGHRLRLEVSSSNFPRFDRNTNTGGDIATEGREAPSVAVNQIHHDRAHRSHLLLPTITRS